MPSLRPGEVGQTDRREQMMTWAQQSCWKAINFAGRKLSAGVGKAKMQMKLVLRVK